MKESLDANGNPVRRGLYHSRTSKGREINIFYVSYGGINTSNETIWIAQFPGSDRTRLTIDDAASCYPLSDREITELRYMIDLSRTPDEKLIIKKSKKKK